MKGTLMARIVFPDPQKHQGGIPESTGEHLMREQTGPSNVRFRPDPKKSIST